MIDINKPAEKQLLDFFGAAIQGAGLTVASRDVSPSLGDVPLTLTGEGIEVRLASDRGIYSADIRPSLAGAE